MNYVLNKAIIINIFYNCKDFLLNPPYKVKNRLERRFFMKNYVIDYSSDIVFTGH